MCLNPCKCLAQSKSLFDLHLLFSLRRCMHVLECVTGVHLFCLLHVFTMHSSILSAHMGWLARVWMCTGVYLSVCVCVCLGLKGTTTGHGLSQTGWARDVLTSPHTLPVLSYSSSFLLKSGLYAHMRAHTHTYSMHILIHSNIYQIYCLGVVALTDTLLSHDYLFKERTNVSSFNCSVDCTATVTPDNRVS